jgi:hypothetical protein
VVCKRGVSERGNEDGVVGHSPLGVFPKFRFPSAHTIYVAWALSLVCCPGRTAETGMHAACQRMGNDDGVVGTLTNSTAPMSWALSLVCCLLVGFVRGPAVVTWQREASRVVETSGRTTADVVERQRWFALVEEGWWWWWWKGNGWSRKCDHPPNGKHHE